MSKHYFCLAITINLFIVNISFSMLDYSPVVSVLMANNLVCFGINNNESENLYLPNFFINLNQLNKNYLYKDIIDKVNLRKVSDCNNINIFSNKYAAIIRPESTLHSTYFKLYDSLSRQYLGKSTIFLPKTAIIDAKKVNNKYVKLFFPEKLVLVNPDLIFNDKITVRIALFSTRYVLSLFNIEQLSNNWGEDSIDRYIEKKIYWFCIENSIQINHQIFNNFNDISKFAQSNAYIVRELDNSPVFLYLTDFFLSKKFDSFQYIIILKDNWDISSESYNMFKTLIKEQLLSKRGKFDIITVNQNGYKPIYQQYLSEDFNTKIIESDFDDKIAGKKINFFLKNFNEFLRDFTQNEIKKKGCKLNKENNFSNEINQIVVSEDDYYFQFGNILHSSQLPLLQHFFQLILKYSKGEDSKKNFIHNVEELMEMLDRNNSSNFNIKNIDSILQKFFPGFQLPDSCILSVNSDLENIFNFCDNEEGEDYFRQIIEILANIYENKHNKTIYFFGYYINQIDSYFISNDIF